MIIDSPITLTSRPPPRRGFVIDRETLQNLDPLEKLAARSAIRRGFWILIDEDVIPCKVSP